MSKTQSIQVTCPKCGAKHDWEIWESINVTLDPTAKERILGGTFFTFSCPDCSFETAMAYNCLYHDMDRKMMVYLLPAEKMEDFDELVEKLPPVTLPGSQNLEDLSKKAAEGYALRAVKDLNLLREKIAASDAGRDDRILEVCKLLLFANLHEARPDLVFDALYYDKDEAEGERVVLFDQEGKMLAYPMGNLYDEVAADFLAQLPQNATDAFEVVDLRWAARFLQQAQIKE